MKLNKNNVSSQTRSAALVGLTFALILSAILLFFAASYVYSSEWNPITLGVTLTLVFLFYTLFYRIYHYFMFFWTAGGIDVMDFPYRYSLGNLFLCFGQPRQSANGDFFVPVFVGPEKLRKREENQAWFSAEFKKHYHRYSIFGMLVLLLKTNFPDINPRDYNVFWNLTSALYSGGGSSGFTIVYNPVSTLATIGRFSPRLMK